MADEYISKEAVIKKIAEVQDKATTGTEDVAYYRAIKIIRDEPVADVQPFKWVRCEESLPVYDGLVLVADRDNNIRLGIFTETGWLSQFGNPMMPRPKAWAKIPELPEAIKG